MPTIKRAVKKRLFCFMFKLCKCNVPSGVLPSVSLRPGIPECSGRCRHNLLQFPIVSGVPCLLRSQTPASPGESSRNRFPARVQRSSDFPSRDCRLPHMWAGFCLPKQRSPSELRKRIDRFISQEFRIHLRQF